VELRTAVAASMLRASRARVATVFKALRETSPQDCAPDDAMFALLSAAGVAAAEHEALVREAFQRADDAIAAAVGAGIVPLMGGDPLYPALLGCIADPPPVLWIRGDAAVLTRPAVAVVGSRVATPYALQVGARLAAELAGRGVVVVSGLARGVDSSAHRGCLEAGGDTVAVLGSGLDCVYPPEHAGLAQRIAEHGVVMAELGPGAAPLAEHFPLRNRIISGISLGVVVVEASEKSGSLITARCALEQGRDVMAVPGSVLSGRNRGSHSLLKDGAKVVETADDILEELGWPGACPAADPVKILISDPLLAQMAPGEGYQLDELIALTGTAGAKLLRRLMDLELLGLVGSVGGRFIRLAAAK
jgi:DNA processing protein